MKEVIVIKYEKFSKEEKGVPENPIITSKSKPMPYKEAVEFVNKDIELMLRKGWKLKLSPEGRTSLYKEESRSITDYHMWYQLEGKEKEENN